MTLLQKLTAAISKDLQISFFHLPRDYDFTLDNQHIKRSGGQKAYKAFLI
jgi:hypothetical protein